jgi:2-amino-4-hydroxy-6-hydroxymethyldihydropteridine diphosphokinase
MTNRRVFPKLHRVYLSTGSNQGQSILNLSQAVHLIEKQIGYVSRTSSIYWTKAWGKTDQPDFFNQCLIVHTTFSPKMVLQKLASIEKQLGRVRIEKWGPRAIDIDILFFESWVIKNESLEIPHPEIQNRMFVLKPLHEIARQLKHPLLNKTVKELLQNTTDDLGVKPIF